jgi:hypothetical protein
MRWGLQMMNNDGADWRQQEEQEEQQFYEYLEQQKKWFKKTLAEFEKNFGGNNEQLSNAKKD